MKKIFKKGELKCEWTIQMVNIFTDKDKLN